MNDIKNILIAWVSSLASVFAVVDTGVLTTIFSAIILPVLFFAVGKTVDVYLQIYLHRRESNVALQSRTEDEGQ